jgi:hypothetical protein
MSGAADESTCRADTAILFLVVLRTTSEEGYMAKHEAAIDILSVIFPTNTYLMLMEKIHPHVPRELLEQAAHQMSPADRRQAAERAQAVSLAARQIAEILTAAG